MKSKMDISTQMVNPTNVIHYQWVLAARACPCAARTRLFGLIAKRSRPCAARTRLFGFIAKRGAARPPPAYCSFAAFPEGPNSAARGVISFHWAKLHLTLHHTELRCTLLSSASPNELHCTLLRGAVPLRYAAPYLSFAAPYLIYAAPSGIL